MGVRLAYNQLCNNTLILFPFITTVSSLYSVYLEDWSIMHIVKLYI